MQNTNESCHVAPLIVRHSPVCIFPGPHNNPVGKLPISQVSTVFHLEERQVREEHGCALPPKGASRELLQVASGFLLSQVV